MEQVKGVTYSLDALLGLTSSPQDIETSGKPDSNQSTHRINDDQQFAKVNGIDYSLDRLLGDDSYDQGGNLPRGWGRLISYRWWKSWVVSTRQTGVPPDRSCKEKTDSPGKRRICPYDRDGLSSSSDGICHV